MFTELQQEYQRLSDDELLHLAHARSSLTDEAKVALDTEIRSRNLTAVDIKNHARFVQKSELRESRRRSPQAVRHSGPPEIWCRDSCGILLDSSRGLTDLTGILRTPRSVPASCRLARGRRIRHVHFRIPRRVVLWKLGTKLRFLDFLANLINGSRANCPCIDRSYWHGHALETSREWEGICFPRPHTVLRRLRGWVPRSSQVLWRTD